MTLILVPPHRFIEATQRPSPIPSPSLVPFASSASRKGWWQQVQATATAAGARGDQTVAAAQGAALVGAGGHGCVARKPQQEAVSGQTSFA